MSAACPLCGNVDLEPGLCGECMRALASGEPQECCVICLEPITSTDPPVEWHGELAHGSCARDADMLASEAACSDDFDYTHDRG